MFHSQTDVSKPWAVTYLKVWATVYIRYSDYHSALRWIEYYKVNRGWTVVSIKHDPYEARQWP